ncbi:MAG: CO dehydrogenase/acetyl-CoA synthase subunit delta [Candidatus Bathyarchaeota archaeon]|nr:MAG: CO dehydrogenase/acetyl-CoA synthase subunit delta [Candidatus Bathyarchaeota archaeon]
MGKKREKEKTAPTELAGLLDILGIESERDIELEDVELNIGELILQSAATIAAPRIAIPPAALAPPKVKPTTILEAPFTPFVQEYPGQVREVTLGATKGEGGSRGKPVIIGGATTPAFYLFEKTPPHPPVITVDVFDMQVKLPKAIRMHVKELWGDPAAWAKLAVDKWGADVVTIHLLSTDPLIKDTPPAKAAKTVEEVLQAVDVPLIIGGCGDPKKDAKVFTKVAEVAEGERVLLSSLTLDMSEAGTLEGLAKAAAKHGHLVLAFTALDLNRARELNRKLYDYMPEDRVVMDLTTAALGYGLEYSFTIHERARMAALMGDSELQHPTLAGTTNAWAARETWLKLGPEWEPRRLRGPLWEATTALALLLAGVDVFMMMHPDAIATMRKVTKQLMKKGKAKPDKIANWVNARIKGEDEGD